MDASAMDLLSHYLLSIRHSNRIIGMPFLPETIADVSVQFFAGLGELYITL